MKSRLKISLKQRIYWSFSLLVFLFVANGVVTLYTITSNKKIAVDIFKVIAPSIEALNDFKQIMLESKMYTTNWEFQSSDLEDKKSLKKIQDSDYINLKSRIMLYSSKWADKDWADSLKRVFAGFEKLLFLETDIMNSLKDLKVHDDPVIKLRAEQKVRDEILPGTTALMNSLQAIIDFSVGIRTEKSIGLERSSQRFRLLLIVLIITIILAGFLLSTYMTRVIIAPIKKINHIVNNLGRGIIQKIDYPIRDDEIGEMVFSVNNLSEKLEATAAFAHEVGSRNFDAPFNPLSQQDSLGNALLVMRDRIKLSDFKFNEAQQVARLGSWERNIETDMMTLSDEMFNIFEIDPVSFDFRFESILQYIHPEDRANVLDIIRRNRYMEPVPIECRIITPKGVIKDIMIETKVRLGKNGDIDKTYGIVQDITDRKKGEEKLHKSEELYRQIVETSQEGIWLIDENRKTTFVNKRLCELLGYSDEEMMGKDVYYFMEESEIKTAAESLERQKLGITDNLDFKFMTKKGAVVWAYLVTNALSDDKGRFLGALAMVTDITQRKLDEEHLRNSELNMSLKNTELENKNKELEQFAYVASHDLQEPLRTTSSFVELLQQQYKGKLDERADKYLSYIAQSSDRMGVLIKDLLDYSRIGYKKELEKVDCSEILRVVLFDLHTAITESKAVIQAGILPVISGYPIEIKLLFQNLITNAIKFRKKDTPPAISISVQKTGDNWEFAFQDNGIGIDKKHRERIFIIFQRLHTRAEYKGSGIGLSHCKKIVDLHNGKIWVESVPGEGSTFHFTLLKNEPFKKLQLAV